MKIGMLFPGYGSQFVGMAKEFYDESRIVQEYFEEASHCLNINFVKLCFASSDVEIARMQNAYTALFLTSSAIYAVVREQGIVPDLIAGYNFGDYAALYAAGCFTFPDGLYLLNKCAALYQEALQDMDVAMLRVTGVPTAALEDICLHSSWDAGRAYIAFYNGAEDNSVSGASDALERVRDMIVQQHPNATIEGEEVEHGLHSPLMDEVVKRFTLYLEKVDFNDLAMPLLSSVDGKKVESGPQARQHVIDLLNKPINWQRCLDKLKPYDVLIEIGPGSMLSGLVKKQYPDKLVMAINKPEDIELLKKIVQPENIEEKKEQAKED